MPFGEGITVSAQGLVCACTLGITSGNIQRIIWEAGDQTQVATWKARALSLYYLSNPKQICFYLGSLLVLKFSIWGL